MVVLFAEGDTDYGGEEGTGSEKQPHHHVVLTALPPIHRLLQLLEQAQGEQSELALIIRWFCRYHLG